jgi:hypothetical protein
LSRHEAVVELKKLLTRQVMGRQAVAKLFGDLKMNYVRMPVLWKPKYATFERLFGRRCKEVRINDPAH